MNVSAVSVDLSLSRLLEETGIKEEKIVNAMIVGSYLHGTATEQSDVDCVLIVEDDCELPEGPRIARNALDVTIFTKSEYVSKLQKGDDFQTLETLWIPEIFTLKHSTDFLYAYNSDLEQLRTAVSSIANKGHGYAKILISKERNFKLGRKNLAHEIRNLYFGLQIVHHHKIIDYQAGMAEHNMIMEETSEDWSYYHEKWGKFALTLQRQFMLLTPKPQTGASKQKSKASKKSIGKESTLSSNPPPVL